jgi:RNA 2',3'-cyclic 3'-phosphodiesterase
MRLFAAITPPADVHERIARVMEELKPLSRAPRWVLPQGLHITLKFFGNVDEVQLPQIVAALKEIRASRALDLKFRGVGSFPKHDRPHVIWAGVEENAGLTALAEAMETRFAPLVFRREEREFSPHITLARIHSRERLDNLVRAAEALASYDFGAMQAREFQLFQSTLKSSGAEYTPLETFRFANDEAGGEDRAK